MAMLNSVLKSVIDVKGGIVKECYLVPGDTPSLRVKMRLSSHEDSRCPVCHGKCRRYDRSENTKAWRTLDFHNLPTYIEGPAYRVECPKHGVQTVHVPWAAPGAEFTHHFDREVAWMCRELSKSAIAEMLRIDWRTVGRCCKRVLEDLEPDTSVRWKNLINIGIDETSYKKGHKYITVIVNHDTNEVVWVAKDHGKEVLSRFFEELGPARCLSIRTVTGDGAGWITDCVEKYCPNATRCMDSFHVVEWICDAMDDIRKGACQKARREISRLKAEAEKEVAAKAEEAAKRCEEVEAAIKEEIKKLLRLLESARATYNESRGRDKSSKEEIARLKAKIENFRRYLPLFQKEREKILSGQAQNGDAHKTDGDGEAEGLALEEAEERMRILKDSKYAFLKNPEKLSENMATKLSLIEASDPALYKAYEYKERIRILLHSSDPEYVAEELEAWIEEARNCDIPRMAELAEKIGRHKEHIVNTARVGLSNARIEATNNKIKLIIRRAYGFRNMENMISTIMLVCSNLDIPRCHRPEKGARKEKAQKARQRADKACAV